MTVTAAGSHTPEWVSRPDVAAVTELLGSVSAADGSPAVSEQGLLALESGTGAGHLVEYQGGRLVGYASLVPAHGDHPAMAELAVSPVRRRQGIGTALLTAILQAGGDGTRVWAHGDGAPARALAHSYGLVPVRTLLRLRRSLAQPLPPLPPASATIRTYQGPADDAELLRVNNAAFSWHPEQGGWTESDLAARRAQPWFDPQGLFLADAGAVRGFHWTKVEPGAATGEVYVVGVDPAAQGQGLGALLTLTGLYYLRDRGLTDVVLYTEADNTAALRTYQKLGFTRDHADVAYAVKK